LGYEIFYSHCLKKSNGISLYYNFAKGGEIILFRKASSAASAANAICDHIFDLHNGTKPGQYVAMSVISDNNNYGIPKGIFFSFPCSIKKGGNYKIIDKLPVIDF